jgi:hypothetical protein
MKAVLICICMALAAGLGAQEAGQVAADMDRLLETPAVSGAQAARFVLGAAGLLPAGLSGPAAEAAAWEAALGRGWVKGEAGGALRLREAAFLVAGAFGLKGGLMYSLLPGPRYAYRELLYRKIIQGRADGNFTVSGERLLRIIGRVLDYTGADAGLDAAAPAPAGEAAGDAPPPGEGMTVPGGKGISSGAEGVLPYKGEFDVE